MSNPKFQKLLDYFRDYVSSVLTPDGKNKDFYQCPFCGSGTHGNASTGALSVDFSKKTWHCFACGQGGGMLQLYAKLNHIDNTKKAFAELCDKYRIEDDSKHPAGRNGNSPRTGKPSDIQTASEARPAALPDAAPSSQATAEAVDYTPYFRNCRKNMDKGGYQYLESRGIPAALGDRFKIGFDPKWEHPKNAYKDTHFYTPRLIIPLGKYAYLARDTRPDQKQWAKMKCGHLRDFFFGQEAINNPLCFFVVEGEMDCLSFYAAGASAVALGSVSRVGAFLKKMVSRKPQGLCLIALDNDDAGKTAAKKLFAGCREFGIACRVIRSVCGPFKDPNAYLMGDPDQFKRDVFRIISNVREEASARYYQQYGMASAIDRLHKERVEGNVPAIPTGYAALDKALIGDEGDGGLRKGSLTVIGAVSSLGKTTWLLQMSDQIAKSGNDVLFFTLEQSRKELAEKSLSRLTYELCQKNPGKGLKPCTSFGVSSHKLWTKYTKQQQDMINFCEEQYKAFAKDHLFFIEGLANIGVAEVRDMAKRHIAITGRPPVVIVDYLHVLKSPNDRFNEMQAIDYNITELRRLARDLDIPVIVVTSFNRENYYMPVSLASAKGSGKIEYSSDVMLALAPKNMRDDDSDKGKRENRQIVESCKRSAERELELYILKNRSARAHGRISYLYNSRYNHFAETSEVYYPEFRDTDGDAVAGNKKF